MANTIWGYANTALYTLHPTHHVVAELDRTGEAQPVLGVTGPWVLGLWTDYGHGIALQGTTAEILHFLGLAIEHVARETRQEGLPDVLNELATVRARREELLAGNPTTEDLEAAARLRAPGARSAPVDRRGDQRAHRPPTVTNPAPGRPFGGVPGPARTPTHPNRKELRMTLTHTDPTDPWTAVEDDDVPMRPDGNVRIAWRDTPHHYIEQTALVYLRLSDAGDRWIVDTSSLDGCPLDSAYEDISAHNSECPCGQPEECERVRAAADQIPLPTGRELAALIVQAL